MVKKIGHRDLVLVRDTVLSHVVLPTKFGDHASNSIEDKLSTKQIGRTWKNPIVPSGFTCRGLTSIGPQFMMMGNHISSNSS